MNTIKNLSFLMFFITCSTGHAMEQINMNITTISRKEALKKIPPQDRFPFIESTFKRNSSEITYQCEEPHFTITLPTGKLFKNVVALHPVTAQFAAEGDPIDYKRSLIIGSLFDGRISKTVPYQPNVAFEELKFSPDAQKVIGISNNIIIIIYFNSSAQTFLYLMRPAPIVTFCTNPRNEELSFSLTNNTIEKYLLDEALDKAPLGYTKFSGKSCITNHPAKQICFGPDSEIIGINSSGVIRHLFDDPEKGINIEHHTFTFPEETPGFEHIKQLYNTGKDDFVFVTQDEESETQFFSLKITKKHEPED